MTKVFGKVNSSFPQVSVGWPGWPWMFWFGTTFLGDWQSEKKRKNGETRNTYSNLNFLAWGQQGCLTSSTPHDIGLSHAPPAQILAEN